MNDQEKDKDAKEDKSVPIVENEDKHTNSNNDGERYECIRNKDDSLNKWLNGKESHAVHIELFLIEIQEKYCPHK